MSHIERNNDGFHIVLPSNVLASGGKNIPSHYHTQLVNSINLDGGRGDNWEVGLVEMSFVNAIKTIDRNEKMHIWKKEAATSKGTSPTKVTFDLGGKYVLLPSSSAPNAPLNQVIMLRNYTITDGGREFFTHPHFNITFHDGLGIFFLNFTNENIASFFMSPYTAYVLGFINNMTLKKTDYTRFFNPKTDNGCEYLIKYSKSPISSAKPRTQSGITNGGQEDYILHLNPDNDSGTATPLEFYINYKVESSFKIEKSIEIPEGYYQTPQRLVETINQTLQNVRGEGIGFTFDENINRIIYKASPGETSYLELDNVLASVLGFSQQKLDKSIVEATYPSDLRRGIYSLFVYCDLCTETYVGNSLVPLLRNVSYNATGGYGQTVTVLYDNPIYVPLNKHVIDSIEMKICDDSGYVVPFIEGKTIITLHFRQRNS